LRYLVDARCFQPLRVKGEVQDEVENLIERGLFIEAAVKAQKDILALGPNTSDYRNVFNLWHFRLQSLVLAGHEKQAAEEARFLGDLDSEKYRLDLLTSVVPWDLRLLVTSLQVKGDGSATLAKLYAMARECRVDAHLAEERAKISETAISSPIEVDPVTSEIWESRLRELALFVTFTLVRLGDVEAAISHLKNVHSTAQNGSEADKQFGTRIVPLIALLYLHMGSTDSARELFTEYSQAYKAEFAESLCAVIDGDWPEAEKLLQKCFEEGEAEGLDEDSTRIKNNLAVSLFYQGKLDGAWELFNDIGKEQDANPVSLKNLFKLRELLQRPEVIATA
jgi:tetratricopeptide (TPR) repeat protein